VEPLGAEKLIFSSLIWIVADEVGQNVVFTLLLRQETVVVLPDVWVGASMERLILGDVFLLLLIFLPFYRFFDKEPIILIRHEFVFFEQSATSQSLNFRLCRLKLQVLVLFLSHCLLNIGWHQVDWQVPQ